MPSPAKARSLFLGPALSPGKNRAQRGGGGVLPAGGLRPPGRQNQSPGGQRPPGLCGRYAPPPPPPAGPGAVRLPMVLSGCGPPQTLPINETKRAAPDGRLAGKNPSVVQKAIRPFSPAFSKSGWGCGGKAPASSPSAQPSAIRKGGAPHKTALTRPWGQPPRCGRAYGCTS